MLFVVTQEWPPRHTAAQHQQRRADLAKTTTKQLSRGACDQCTEEEQRQCNGHARGAQHNNRVVQRQRRVAAPGSWGSHEHDINRGRPDGQSVFATHLTDNARCTKTWNQRTVISNDFRVEIER